jgi:hypothetical protein
MTKYRLFHNINKNEEYFLTEYGCVEIYCSKEKINISLFKIQNLFSGFEQKNHINMTNDFKIYEIQYFIFIGFIIIGKVKDKCEKEYFSCIDKNGNLRFYDNLFIEYTSHNNGHFEKRKF